MSTAVEYRVTGDSHSNHGLPIGAIVTRVAPPDWSDSADWFTLGGVDDEVSIDPRDRVSVSA